MCELGVNPATLLVSGACSLGVPGIYMEAGHVVTEFAAVSLSVVYITMTVKKTFMVTKLTTEPAAICGGGTPLEERKKIFSVLFLPFWGSSPGCTCPEFVGKNSLSQTPCEVSALPALCQPASRCLARTGQLALAGSELPRCYLCSSCGLRGTQRPQLLQ